MNLSSQACSLDSEAGGFEREREQWIAVTRGESYTRMIDQLCIANSGESHVRLPLTRRSMLEGTNNGSVAEGARHAKHLRSTDHRVQQQHLHASSKQASKIMECLNNYDGIIP